MYLSQTSAPSILVGDRARIAKEIFHTTLVLRSLLSLDDRGDDFKQVRHFLRGFALVLCDQSWLGTLDLE